MQALQSRVGELEQDISLTRKEISEMVSFKHKMELKNMELTNENIGLELAKSDLKDSLAEKKDELIQMKDDLVLMQKAMMKKNSLL